MEESSPNAIAYRQLLDLLQDLRAAGVAQIPTCDLAHVVSQTATSPSAATRTAPRANRASEANPAARRASNPTTPTATTSSPAPREDAPPTTSRPPSPRPSRALQDQLQQGSTPVPSVAPDAANQDPPADLTAPPLATLSDLDDDTRRQHFEVLNNTVRNCTTCPELVQNRSQTVFGVGSIRPRLCFFGEAPGADEDRRGEPFVGRAGQLLNKIIGAMTLRREDVYILNAIKCRPPGNRNPTLIETSCCRAYWVEQLEILRPEFICCLGGVAANTLFASNESVGKMRNRWLEYRGAQVMVTYHPAYLLRNEFAKRYAWADIQKLMEAMGLQRGS